MNRGYTLPDGCKNLSDEIRVFSPDNADWGFMTVAEAQSRARALDAELVLLARGRGMKVFRLVDGDLKQRLRSKKRK